MSSTVRILVVDDSLLYRTTLRRALGPLPGVEVVGSAADGVQALEMIAEHDPDLLTLDVQMPELDGIGVLKAMKARGSRAKAVMVSSLTASGAKETTDSLLEGAFDFILKPSEADPDQNLAKLRASLRDKIEAFRQSQTGGSRVGDVPTTGERFGATRHGSACRLVVIGASTGGPAALREVLPRLPASLPAPVIVVQHMPPGYTAALAARLDELCPLDVREGAEGMRVNAGQVCLAPGGLQLRLARDPRGLSVRLTEDPPEHGCRPAVDYLLRSAAGLAAAEVLAVILTGMGSDGVLGCREIRRCGGRVIAQDAETSSVFGMPRGVIVAGLANVVAPLGRIGGEISALVRHA